MQTGAWSHSRPERGRPACGPAPPRNAARDGRGRGHDDRRGPLPLLPPEALNSASLTHVAPQLRHGVPTCLPRGERLPTCTSTGGTQVRLRPIKSGMDQVHPDAPLGAAAPWSEPLGLPCGPLSCLVEARAAVGKRGWATANPHPMRRPRAARCCSAECASSCRQGFAVAGPQAMAAIIVVTSADARCVPSRMLLRTSRKVRPAC